MKQYLKLLNYAIVGIEVLVAIALVALAVAALVTLGVEMSNLFADGSLVTSATYNRIIGTVLEIFILVELFRIAIAYMNHENVIPTVLEAALVAVARKFVVFETSPNYLQTTLGMSALLLAVAASWWMLARSNACELRE
jgi:uncharacterized membrane protein (DUF373 family)